MSAQHTFHLHYINMMPSVFLQLICQQICQQDILLTQNPSHVHNRKLNFKRYWWKDFSFLLMNDFACFQIYLIGQQRAGICQIGIIQTGQLSRRETQVGRLSQQMDFCITTSYQWDRHLQLQSKDFDHFVGVVARSYEYLTHNSCVVLQTECVNSDKPRVF